MKLGLGWKDFLYPCGCKIQIGKENDYTNGGFEVELISELSMLEMICRRWSGYCFIDLCRGRSVILSVRRDSIAHQVWALVKNSKMYDWQEQKLNKQAIGISEFDVFVLEKMARVARNATTVQDYLTSLDF